jgi:hypothetical protein
MARCSPSQEINTANDPSVPDMIQDHGQLAPEARQLPLVNGASAAKRSLQEVCQDLRDRIDTFLNEEQSTELLKQVQQQLRISMGVVEDALTEYECVGSDTPFLSLIPPSQLHLSCHPPGPDLSVQLTALPFLRPSQLALSWNGGKDWYYAPNRTGLNIQLT